MSSVDSLRARFAQEEYNRQVANSAALKGAVRAFPKQNGSAVTSPSSQAVRSPQSSASAAASKIWQDNAASKPPRPPAKPHSLSAASLGAVRAHHKSQENLVLQQGTAHRSQSSSPSNAAAVLAAARHKSLSPTSPAARLKKPQTQLRHVSEQDEAEDGQDHDRLPEPGTVRDVKKWLQTLEGSSNDPDNVTPRKTSEASSTAQLASQSILPQAQPEPLKTRDVQKTPRSPPILSPRPLRAISVTDSIEAAARPQPVEQETSIRPRPTIPPKRVPQLRSSANEQDEERPPLPSRTRTSSSFSTAPSHLDESLSLQKTRSKPEAPPPRRTRPPTQPASGAISSAPQPQPQVEVPPTLPTRPTAPTKSSTDSIEKPPPLPIRSYTDATTSTPSLFNPNRSRTSLDLPDRALPLRRVSPSISQDQLANAIVGASLASSRAPSPSKSPAPSLPPRPGGAQQHKWHVPFKSHDSRPTSPSKSTRSLRTTLRRSDSISSDDGAVHGHAGHHHRKFLIRKHPNKHHEGDRKRYQDQITAAERKRYEGVWAANRGLLLSWGESDADAKRDGVHGFVVRDVWRRSKLPTHILEEVWELVDHRREGWLDRAEFVVGMWLIDRRLRGRKLPTKVGESVWSSVKVVDGVVLRGG